jgi:hypothetical protein
VLGLVVVLTVVNNTSVNGGRSCCDGVMIQDSLSIPLTSSSKTVVTVPATSSTETHIVVSSNQVCAEEEEKPVKVSSDPSVVSRTVPLKLFSSQHNFYFQSGKTYLPFVKSHFDNY